MKKLFYTIATLVTFIVIGILNNKSKNDIYSPIEYVYADIPGSGGGEDQGTNSTSNASSCDSDGGGGGGGGGGDGGGGGGY